MPGERPYNELQLAEITREMLERDSSAIPLPQPVPQNIVHEADFVPYPRPGKIPRAAIVIGKFVGSSFRVFSPSGREERAEERAGRFEKRMEVAAFLGQRILNPRTTVSATEKIGWVGTHKTYIKGSTVDKSAAGFLGKSLMDSKNEKEEEFIPNLNRPSTRAERDRDRRLEAAIEKSRRLRREAKWRNDSYGDNLRANRGVRLRPKEAKHMSSVARDIIGADKKAQKLEKRFNKIANYEDVRGKVLRWRIDRARSFPKRQNERYEKVATTVIKGGRLASETTKAVARGSVTLDKATRRAVVRGGKIIARGSKTAVKNARKPFKKSTVEEIERSDTEQSE